MPNPTPSELKKLLSNAGFEIYRTAGDRVELADRVRDNLIMDSGVSVLAAGGELVVRFITRAQASEFTGESEEQLFERARLMGAGAVELRIHRGVNASCPRSMIRVTGPECWTLGTRLLSRSGSPRTS